MNIEIFGSERTVDGLVAAARTAHEQGFEGYWMPQIFGLDALTAIAAASTQVDGIRFGTSVIPTYPRHPMMLAQQALTANQVSGGRLQLGIGLSHQMVVEGMWGISFDKPLRHMREYLEILVPLIQKGSVSFEGDTLTGKGDIDVPADPCPVLVAALGPKMLELTGRVADGTITWMVGAKTIADHTAPTINAAAEAAGRPAPDVACGLPVCVTDDVDGARARAAELFAIYGMLPSYRAMLDREGLDGPADLAAIGSTDQVKDRIGEMFDAGATRLAASEFGTPDELAATRQALVELL